MCAAASASAPAPPRPMQPWQCLRRFALAWWERTAEGSARSPREEAGARDPGGRREPGEQEQRLCKEGIPDCLFLSPNTMKPEGPAAPNFKGSGFLAKGFQKMLELLLFWGTDECWEWGIADQMFRLVVLNVPWFWVRGLGVRRGGELWIYWSG